jgi:hypothetical protein
MSITASIKLTESSRFARFLAQPIDNSPLIVFRILFGLLIFLESIGAIFTGWVKETFIDPTHHLPFIGFEWLQPLPGYGMYGYYLLMSVFGLMVMLGLFYRFSMATFTLMWTATYLMQKFNYNNHYYLLILLCILMLMVPAHKYASLDVRRKPAIQSLTCPRWCISIFILELWIVFTYAAIAKIQPDWLSARPISLWFQYKTDYPLIGPLLATDWIKWVVAYGGIFFDLLIVPLLLWKRTRLLAFVASLIFHGFNSAVFQIGIFPYLMIGADVFFFEPEKVRKIFFKQKPSLQLQNNPNIHNDNHLPNQFILGGLAIFFVLQIALPVRHLLYPGDVNWTEEGHRMSWRMMLRSKGGNLYFKLKNPKTDEQWNVYLSDYLTDVQAADVATHPDMIWQVVQLLKNKYAAEGIEGLEIYAVSEASLNGRPYQIFVDPAVNLAKVEWEPFSHASWILPMKEE